MRKPRDRFVGLWRGVGHVDQAWTLLGYVGLQGWLAAALSSLLVWLIGMLTQIPWAYSLTCASVMFAAVVAASYYWERRRQLLPTSSVPSVAGDAGLELVCRIGQPFLEEHHGPGKVGKTPSRTVSKLIGVRNTSSNDIHDVRVQVASASQATSGLPLTLPPREGPHQAFSLAPGEMRLVRFVRQAARIGKPLGMGSLGGRDGPSCLAPCELVLAAYADGASTLRTVWLYLDDGGEIQIQPPILGELPGGVEPAGYVRFVIGPIERKNP
jgi:hypothetical protein